MLRSEDSPYSCLWHCSLPAPALGISYAGKFQCIWTLAVDVVTQYLSGPLGFNCVGKEPIGTQPNAHFPTIQGLTYINSAKSSNK